MARTHQAYAMAWSLEQNKNQLVLAFTQQKDFSQDNKMSHQTLQKPSMSLLLSTKQLRYTKKSAKHLTYVSDSDN